MEAHNRATTTAYAFDRTPCLIPNAVANNITNGQWLTTAGEVVAWPITPAAPNPRRIKMAMAYNVSDLGVSAQPSITHLGASRTFYALGSTLSMGAADVIRQGATGLLGWWSD